MFNDIINRYKLLPVQVRASVWYLFCYFMQKGTQVITTPVFTRLLTPTEYGGYQVFSSWYGVISVIVTLNIFYGVFTQGLIKFKEERNIFSSSLQGLTLTMVLFWLGVYVLNRTFWNGLISLTTFQMFCMFVMLWSTAVFFFWAAERRVDYDYKKLVVLTIAVSVLKPAVSILLITISDDKVTAWILGMTIAEVLGYSWLFVAKMVESPTFFNSRFWKYALCLNIPLLPHYLSQMVLNNSDRIMINQMVDARSAGIYGLAYSISLIMTIFNTALLQTIGPWLYQKMRDSRIEEISAVSYFCLVIIAIVNLVLIALAPEFVAIFAPPSYSEAIYIIPPVSMSVIFIFSYDLFSTVEFYQEKTYLLLIASVMAAAINIALNFVFIKKFGYLAAGYTTLVCYIIYASCHYIFARRLFNRFYGGVQPYQIKPLAYIYVFFMFLGFVFLLLYKHPILRYGFFLVIVSIIVYERAFMITKIKTLIAIKRNKSLC